jgi:hypothetical protein
VTEYCCSCKRPTGRAGKGDDSLYCDVCGAGPFCEECYDSHIAWCHGRDGRAKARQQREAAQQAVIKAASRVVDCAEEVSTPDPDGPCVFEVGVLLMLELRSAIARYRAALAALDGEPK